MFRSNNGFVIFNKHIRSALLLQFVLITVMTIIQSFAAVSVPVTTIRLAHNSYYEYGVLGWCITQPQRQCTGRNIGYKDALTELSGVKLLLPSESKYSVSKLLLFHILSFGLSVTLWVLIVIAMVSPLQDSPLFLLLFALLIMTMFLFSLLSWLVDILLFRIWMDWPGWLMLSVAITSAFCGSAIWSYRRSVEMRNYTALNEETSILSVHQLRNINKIRNIDSKYQENVEMTFPLESNSIISPIDHFINESRTRTQRSQEKSREPETVYYRTVEG